MKIKITLSLTLIFLISFVRVKAQAPPEILHYNFDGTGTVIPNMASSPPTGAANATIVGTQTLGGTGQCLGALVGDGSTTSYVNTGWTTSLSGSWSISFWTASITPSSTLWYIFGDATATSFRCFTNGVAGANNWMLRGPITDILLSGGATMSPQLNTFVYNSTAGTTTSYLNGVFNASVTQGPVTITGTGPFKVGQYGTNSGLPSGGLMDEFRFYSRALTVSEIQQLATLVPTPTAITVTSCGTYTSTGNNTYSTSGVYTETVVSCGGNATNTINLTVNPVPTLSVTASSTLLCVGESSNLLTNGTASTFSWSSGPATASISIAPITNTSYVVTGSLSTCAVSRTINITVNPTPLVNLTASSASICLGNSITLSASGAPIYSWSPVTSSIASLVDFPTTTTIYSVTGTNTYNCSDTKTVSVAVHSYTPGITSSTAICAGAEISLSATGGMNYNWSTNSPFSSISVTPAVTTDYSVTAISLANGCPGSNSVTVTVNQNPTITASANTTVMCKGETNTLKAIGAPNYSWSSSSSSSGTITITPTVNIPITYTVTGIAANGCTDKKLITITVNACTGLNEISSDRLNLNIYPNPGKGLFVLRSGEDLTGKTIRILNVLGSLVLEETIKANETTIDLQDQAKGLYFVYLSDSKQTNFVTKLIKE